MQCEKYQLDIQRFLDDDLNDQEKEELYAHLEECPACKREFHGMKIIHQQLLDLPKIRIDESFIEELTYKMDLINARYDQNRKPTTWFRRYRKYILPGLAAAALFIAVLANQDHFNFGGTPYAGERINTQSEQFSVLDDGMAIQSQEIELPEADQPMAFKGTEKFMRNDNVSPMLAAESDQEGLQEITFQKEDVKRLPADVRKWVELSKQIFAGQSYVYGGKTYIYVSVGESSAQGSGVDIRHVYTKDNQLYVYADVETPQSVSGDAGDFQADVLVSVAQEYSDVDFNEWQGARIETWIPEIYDLEEMPQFYDQSSDIIKLYSPLPEETFTNSILIKGIARTYAGAVYYRLVTDHGEEIASGYIDATRGAPDWGAFEQEIFVDLPQTIDTVHAKIEIYESLHDGAKQGTVNLPIVLKGRHSGGSDGLQGKQWVSYVVTSVDLSKQTLDVKQLLHDEADVQKVHQLQLAGVPILRNMAGTGQQEYAQIKDIKVSDQIGAVLAADGKAKEIFLFD